MTAPTPVSTTTKLLTIGRDIKLSHSVFALPFAGLAACYAAGGWPTAQQIALLLWCMFFARTFAMLCNRFVDRRIDAANPRTAGRALPAGRLRPRDAVAAIVLCALMFIAGAAGFIFANHPPNPWPLICSPLVLAWLGAYGLFKRFTVLAHFFLGGALGISPIAAVIAIDPTILADPMPWLLGAFVLLWVAGFDVIYAIQDIDVDRAQQLHSIPARLGPAGALIAAKIIHLAALGLLVTIQRTALPFRSHQFIPDTNLSFFALGMLIVALLLIAEHRAAARGQFTMAFFTLNGVISLVLGALGIADILPFS